jgi:hypothetical protein
MQNKIIRDTFNANYNDHTRPFYAQLQILRRNDSYKVELGNICTIMLITTCQKQFLTILGGCIIFMLNK